MHLYISKKVYLCIFKTVEVIEDSDFLGLVTHSSPAGGQGHKDCLGKIASFDISPDFICMEPKV